MAVSDDFTRPSAAIRLPLLRLGIERRTLLVALGFIAATLFLRLPTFFEPPWHADEGIFAAVAQRVAGGGQLYADAWEAKPPLFIYIYVALNEAFGGGVLPLRIATAISAIGTELALFAISGRFLSRRYAFLAAGLLAVLLAVPFWEGNLALADTFVILPSSLAVLCCLNAARESQSTPSQTARWSLLAGVLFGAAFLIRPTSVVVGLAVVLWLLVSGRPWLRGSTLMALGGALAILPVVGAFALFGSFYWFWNANVGFFFDYVPSGRELPFHYRPLIATPTLVTLAALAWYRWREGATPRWSLAALWLSLALAVALLTGRPYSHYLLQAFPPLALLVALLLSSMASQRLAWRPRFEHGPAFAIAGAIAVLWLAIVTPAFNGNALAMRYTKSLNYYSNFAAWSLGLKSQDAYDDYFDRRVNLTERLDATLDRLGAEEQEVYIWGEVPWTYALADSQPATRYVTSFYVLLIPSLDVGLGSVLEEADPRFIVVTGDVWPRIQDDSGILKRRYFVATRAINSLIARRYEQVAVVGRARIFQRTPERPTVSNRPPLLPVAETVSR